MTIELKTCGAAPEYPSDLNSQQRVALITLWLAAGRKLTTADLMTATGLSSGATWLLMSRLSNVLPIWKDDDGRWRWIEEDA